MIIFKILMCLLLLIVFPSCMGLLLVNPLERGERSLALLLPAGYMVMMISFEVVTVPILLLTQYQNFKYVCFIYTPAMLILGGIGVFLTLKREKNSGVHGLDDLETRLSRSMELYKVPGTEAKIVWGIALLILIVILFLVETRVIFDGDDAYYVTQSLITQQNGTMYVSQPYTGRAASLDIRHALAVFTMWIAYVGKMTGIHTTILCHTVLPLVLIPLCLHVYMEIGIRLFREKKELIPYFMVFMELLILFGRVSIYTPEAFLLARTWQGKAVAANILIPMTFLALLIFFGSTEKSRWLMLIMVNAAAGIFSSLAIVLVSITILIGGFVTMIKEKRILNMVWAGMCCLPGAFYMAVYIYYTYWGWR